jgi:uncharacterized protein YdeI (YjbR/CyaY-like superfamily)
MDDPHDFKSRKEWRSWLIQNHDKSDSAWLTFHKKSSGKKGITLEESVEEAICFGWIDGKLKKIDAEKFVLRFSPRKANSVWSKINKERAERLIKSGRMTSAGLAKIESARKSGWWDKAYTNKTVDELPADLEQALMKEKVAWENFQRFANSYRNMYIGWVNDAKTDATRQKRIQKVVEQARKNKKTTLSII